MKQLNTTLFACFALLVLFGAAFAYDYFKKLEASVGRAPAAATRQVELEEWSRPGSSGSRRAETVEPAIEAAESLNSALDENRAGLLESATPELRIEPFDGVFEVERPEAP